MRKKYKNQIFQLLLSSEFGIEAFEISEQQMDNSPISLTIEVKNTPLYFIIRNSSYDFDTFNFQFVKDAPNYPVTALYPTIAFMSFDAITDSLKGWLESVVNPYFKDQQEPDLWEEFKKGNKVINLNEIDFNNQSSFSFEEVKQIELSINELKFLIQSSLKTSKEEQEIVNNRLDYLIQASTRLNKFDWKSLALSTLFSISIALSLDTEKGHVLFELFKKVFSIVRMLM